MEKTRKLFMRLKHKYFSKDEQHIRCDYDRLLLPLLFALLVICRIQHTNIYSKNELPCRIFSWTLHSHCVGAAERYRLSSSSVPFNSNWVLVCPFGFFSSDIIDITFRQSTAKNGNMFCSRSTYIVSSSEFHYIHFCSLFHWNFFFMSDQAPQGRASEHVDRWPDSPHSSWMCR